MNVYFTDSQVPELRELPPEVRRLVIGRALGILRSRARLFYWLPTLLCVVGGVSGAVFGSALLASFHQSPAIIDGESVIWSCSGMVVGAWTAGFSGLLLQRLKLRPHLRRVLAEFVGKILSPA